MSPAWSHDRSQPRPRSPSHHVSHFYIMHVAHVSSSVSRAQRSHYCMCSWVVAVVVWWNNPLYFLSGGFNTEIWFIKRKANLGMTVYGNLNSNSAHKINFKLKSFMCMQMHIQSFVTLDFIALKYLLPFIWSELLIKLLLRPVGCLSFIKKKRSF